MAVRSGSFGRKATAGHQPDRQTAFSQITMSKLFKIGKKQFAIAAFHVLSMVTEASLVLAFSSGGPV